MPSRIPTHLAYRILAAATGAACILVGILLVVAFLDRSLFPVFARPLFETDFQGYFTLAFAGCALFAWGGCLIASARLPHASPGIATATATALIVAAIVRLLAWYSGEYWLARDQLRVEAGLFACAALAFIWLKPDRRVA